MNQVTAPITQQDPQMSGSTLLPGGTSWALWYHSSEEKKWTPSTYKKIHSVATWGEFWGLIDTLGEESLLGGFFFMMRDPIPPLWENKGNIRGGSYTIRVPRKDSSDLFLRYSIASIIGETLKQIDNNVIGVSIAPKKAYNVISIWNEDFARFNQSTDLNIMNKSVRLEEIRYTKHIDKKF